MIGDTLDGPMRNFFPQPCYEPMTMLMIGSAALSGGSAIAGGIASGGQARQQAENDAVALEQQAQNDDYEAEILKDQAESEIQVGRADAADFTLSESAKVSERIADIGGSGLTLSGSKLAITEADFEAVEFGIARIGANARIGSLRKTQQASFSTRNAEVRRQNAISVRKGGKITANRLRTAGFIKGANAFFGGIASSGLSFGGGSGVGQPLATGGSILRPPAGFDTSKSLYARGVA